MSKETDGAPILHGLLATTKTQDMLGFAKKHGMAIVRIVPKATASFPSYQTSDKVPDFTKGPDPFDSMSTAEFEANQPEHILLSKSGLSFYFYDEEERSWSKAFSCYLKDAKPEFKIVQNFTGIDNDKLYSMYKAAPCPVKKKASQETTTSLWYEGPIGSETQVKAFINKQFKGKNKMAVKKPEKGDTQTSFRIILPNAVPQSSKWVDALNTSFWKEYPELKNLGGFGY